ncbi:hypothetical protein RHGRI_016987 [Rhododendron griersonianum]|uniref:Uncharacterized protein n=1 Tax=Rhododendron griersonianum TaxID=479676 RepID=A0AAV6JWA8_9ERIC|nr:hypothetical protein RHGRI_016987 [Rhododendron griersonianum]
MQIVCKEDIAKCKAAVEEGSKKKKDKLQAAKEIRKEVTIIKEEEDDEEVEIVGTRKRPHTLDPIDKYVSDTNPEKKMTGQQNISASLWTARSEKVDSYLARWVYEASIPFHAIDNNSFAQFCEADQNNQNDSSIMEAVVECVERFYPEDVDAQDYVINKELLMYNNKADMFGKIVALRGCESNNDNYDPGRKKEKDVLLASEATNAQGWIVEGGGDDEVEPGSGITYELLATTMGVDEVFMPRRRGRNVGVREPRGLHEEDFISEDDSEEEGNEEIDFESDGDQVLEGYGGEELEEEDEL